MADVSLRKVVKRYDEVEAVRGIDLDIADHEFVVLVGPSGCGKSTTLRMIAGLEDISDGDIMIGGDVVNDVPPKDRDIAMVFQNYALYPHMTVAENMSFGLRLKHYPKAEIKSRVTEAARMLDITDLIDRKPKQLSGGQRQRVAMGRAIVRNPKVFLFDEPLSNLDAKLRVQMRIEIKKVHQKVRTTTVYVTHDQVEAMTMASRIGVIKDGQLLQLGTPREIYESPSSSYVASRLGTPQINFLPARLLSDVAMPQGTETVGIRTEHLQLAARNGGRMVARVHRVEHLGEQNHIHLDYKGETLVTLADPHQPLQAGQEVDLQLVHPLCFDRAGQRIVAAVH
jgi:multiple sugar transport system ATP-binding protein